MSLSFRDHPKAPFLIKFRGYIFMGRFQKFMGRIYRSFSKFIGQCGKCHTKNTARGHLYSYVSNKKMVLSSFFYKYSPGLSHKFI